LIEKGGLLPDVIETLVQYRTEVRIRVTDILKGIAWKDVPSMIDDKDILGCVAWGVTDAKNVERRAGSNGQLRVMSTKRRYHLCEFLQLVYHETVAFCNGPPPPLGNETQNANSLHSG